MKFLFVLLFLLACASHHHEEPSSCEEYDRKFERMEGNSFRR